MMKKCFSILFGLSLGVAVTHSHANTFVGLDVGLGSSDYESSSDDVDTAATAGITLGYDITQKWAASLSYVFGSGTSVARENIGTATEADEEMDFSAVSLSGHHYFALNQSQSINVSVGINYNQTEVTLLGNAPIDENGVGYTLGVAWQYDFGKWRIKTGAQRLGLSDIDVDSANIGVVFEF